MNFNSLHFLVFFPCVLILYYLFRPSWRNALLLAASYYFYMCWNPLYSLLMLSSTLITYFSALFIAKYQKLSLVISLVLNLSILFCFKYFNFIASLASGLLQSAGLAVTSPVLNLLLPIGISFYTFQALGYTIDVYRGDTKAERNFLAYALFVSFFPQLVAGPIERSGNLLPQFKKEHPFDLENIKAGLTPFLWGFFKKLVLADQLAVFVNRVYDAPQICGAQELVVATVAFAFQIYCDFSAYSDIACGSAKMLGFSLMQNFNRPYFAVSIKDFWHRWHISLSTWFKEYLYIPLGGSRRVRWRTNCNVLIVFALSGLWHGAALNYVVWGCLNGLYQVIGNFLQPLKKRFYAGLHLSATNRLWLLLRRLCTFTLICIAWIFFRANSVGEAVYILRTILFSFFEKDYFRTALSSLDRAGWLSLIQLCFCLILLLLVDYKSQKQSVRKRFEDSLLLRYSAYFVLIAMTLIFGAYGSGFDPLDFVYFQF